MLQPVLDGSELGTFTRHRVNDIVDRRNRAVRSILSRHVNPFAGDAFRINSRLDRQGGIPGERG